MQSIAPLKEVTQRLTFVL